MEQLREPDDPAVTEIARTLDLSRSTVHNHLGTLNRLGYVVRDGNTCHPGAKFL